MTVLVVARGQAIIDRIVPLLRGGGIDAFGTIEDEEAAERLEAPNVAALVIGGGVEAEARSRLSALASEHGVPVIEGSARGKDPAAYVRDELIPALLRAHKGAV